MTSLKCKIERPVADDDSRLVGPPWMKDSDGNESTQSTYYQTVNRNKRSVAVNFADPAGAEIIRDLVKDAVVFVENFRPETLDNYGLGNENLKALVEQVQKNREASCRHSQHPAPLTDERDKTRIRRDHSNG